MDLRVVGVVVLACAAALGSVDLCPGNKMRLKDLDASPESWASHGDVFKLIFSMEA